MPDQHMDMAMADSGTQGPAGGSVGANLTAQSQAEGSAEGDSMEPHGSSTSGTDLREEYRAPGKLCGWHGAEEGNVGPTQA